MTAPAARFPMTPDEYLAFEDASPLRHEYVRGEIFAMSGASTAHNDVVSNLNVLLRDHLRGRDCRTYFVDVKLRVEEAGAFFYPDVFVTCDPRDREDPLVQRHPLLIFEVLSDGTADYDCDEKFADYRKLETLREYVLVDSRHRRVDVYRRNDRGTWEFVPAAAEGTLVLESIGLTVPVAVVYENTDVPAHRPRVASRE
jgi:Uma2 family endonuclease